MTTYKPQVNDFVKWNKDIEGWVYFKCEEYITIEHSVRLKDKVNYECCSIHKNDRLLVLCYKKQWSELKCMKTRESVYEEEKKYVEIDF